MPPPTLDYAPRIEFDTGRFVARYLEVLAWLSIATMIASLIFSDAARIDFTPLLLFWAASALKRRSRTARMWVLAFAGLTLCGLLVLVVWAIFRGTDGMTISLGGRRFKDPAGWQFAGLIALNTAIVGVPLAVLLSERARRQFAKGAALA